MIKATPMDSPKYHYLSYGGWGGMGRDMSVVEVLRVNTIASSDS